MSRPPSSPSRPTPDELPASSAAAASLSEETRRDFALIVPAFNEAPVVPELVRELRRAWEAYGLEGEILLVDDGSSSS